MFENKVLRRIFGSKEEEVMEGWRQLSSVELHDLYVFLPNIIGMIRSRRKRWWGISMHGGRQHVHKNF